MPLPTPRLAPVDDRDLPGQRKTRRNGGEDRAHSVVVSDSTSSSTRPASVVAVWLTIM